MDLYNLCFSIWYHIIAERQVGATNMALRKHFIIKLIFQTCCHFDIKLILKKCSLH
jgi:hypothetical protein